MSADSSDDEPAWLKEQVSARKVQETISRLSDSDDLSLADGALSDEDDAAPKGKAKAKAKADGGAATGGEGKAKGKGRAAPSARLPLMFAPKVRRDLLLLEADDPNLDLSGDFGCIGKLHVRKSSGGGGASSSQRGEDGGVAEFRQTLMLDLKGKVYDADILPCNSLCLLTVDASKAKIEGVFSDFVQLAAPRDSIFDAQEVQGGELGAGFFDDDEVLSNVDGDEEDDEELGPLKERRGGAKMASKGKKAPARKPKGGKAAGAGAKRKAPAAKGGAAKKQKQ